MPVPAAFLVMYYGEYKDTIYFSGRREVNVTGNDELCVNLGWTNNLKDVAPHIFHICLYNFCFCRKNDLIILASVTCVITLFDNNKGVICTNSG